VVTKEASWLQDSNTRLTQDDPPALVWLRACSLLGPNLMTLVLGSRVIRAGMVVQLVTVKKERNAAILKVIEKDGVLKRSSEQLQSTY
jgi:hypothetical protein